MNLTDFYLPLLNFKIIILVIIFFGGLEISGFALASLLKAPKFLRLVNYFFAWVLWAFIWFCLHFFWPFRPIYVWLTFGGLVLPAIPYYYKHQGYKSLIKAGLAFPWIFLFILPFGKHLLFLVSSPPYAWDEMAYHYMSYYDVLHQVGWGFKVGSFLGMIPKALDIVYILSFALSKTYVLARLLHLSIYLTSLSVIGTYLKNKFSLASGLIFAYFAIYLQIGLLKDATTGYVDVAVAAVSLVILLVVFTWIINPLNKKLFSLTAVLALSLSLKYSNLGFVLALLLISLVMVIVTKRQLFIQQLKLLSVKTLFYLGLIALIFGGYWYLKNLIMTGSPVYPFMPLCHNQANCQLQSWYFSDYTLPITWQNLGEIQKYYFNEQVFESLIIWTAILLSLIIGYWQKNKTQVLLTVFLSLTFVLEVFLQSKFSAFNPRFFLHWNLLIPLCLALPFSWPKNKFSLEMKMILGVILVSFSFYLFNTAGVVASAKARDFNDPKKINNEQHAYALGQIDLNRWIELQLPGTKHVIDWCANSSESKVIAIVDPQLIWRSYEGLFRIYMLNCKWEVLPDPSSMAYKNRLVELKNEAAKLASLDPCQREVENPFDENTPEAIHYAANQDLVCQLTETAPHLYEFK